MELDRNLPRISHRSGRGTSLANSVRDNSVSRRCSRRAHDETFDNPMDNDSGDGGHAWLAGRWLREHAAGPRATAAAAANAAAACRPAAAATTTRAAKADRAAAATGAAAAGRSAADAAAITAAAVGGANSRAAVAAGCFTTVTSEPGQGGRLRHRRDRGPGQEPRAVRAVEEAPCRARQGRIGIGRVDDRAQGVRKVDSELGN